MKRAAAVAALIVAAVPATAAASSLTFQPPEPRSVVVVGAGVERRWADGAGDTGVRVDLLYDLFFAHHRLSLGLRAGGFLGEAAVPHAGLRLGLWSYNPQHLRASGGRVYLAVHVGGWRSADHQLDLFSAVETGVRNWFGHWIVDVPLELGLAPLAGAGTWSFHAGIRLGHSF